MNIKEMKRFVYSNYPEYRRSWTLERIMDQKFLKIIATRNKSESLRRCALLNILDINFLKRRAVKDEDCRWAAINSLVMQDHPSFQDFFKDRALNEEYWAIRNELLKEIEDEQFLRVRSTEDKDESCRKTALRRLEQIK